MLGNMLCGLKYMIKHQEIRKRILVVNVVENIAKNDNELLKNDKLVEDNSSS